MQKPTIILAIESSCDDTSCALIQDGRIISNLTAGQEIHRQYGGVVPELAGRSHQANIVPVVHQALQAAQVQPFELSAIAFTQCPGLIGSLLVGASFAKSLALALNIPLIAVNHIHGHIYSPFVLKQNEEKALPKFPMLCLTVSGGHTQLVKVNAYPDMEILGETSDDAVGEAFDKAAKILGLPYPGGPLIDKWAQQGNPNAYSFPKSKMEGYHFSFSGIKTAFLNFVHQHRQKNPAFVSDNMADICASYQQHLVNTLLEKLTAAALHFKINHISLAGGVSANSGLRQSLLEQAQKHQWHIHLPDFEYCTDNAAMIAQIAWYKYQQNHFADLQVSPSARVS